MSRSSEAGGPFTVSREDLRVTWPGKEGRGDGESGQTLDICWSQNGQRQPMGWM